MSIFPITSEEFPSTPVAAPPIPDLAASKPTFVSTPTSIPWQATDNVLVPLREGKSIWPSELLTSLTRPLLILASLTLLFRYTSLDLTISSWFFDAQHQTWNWFFWGPCTTFYRLGIYPPITLAILGGAALVFGPWVSRSTIWTRSGAFLLLLLVIGPGLIVNTGLKPNWGRARPHEVREFGGEHDFSPVGSPGAMHDNNSSFPSGHAALAFYMLAPAFLVRHHRPVWAPWLFGFGALYGLGMSAARVIQGAHFTSDVLWSGGIMYLTAAILAHWLLPRRDDAA